MRLLSTLAAAAAVSSAVAADVPAGKNYTFSALTSTTTSGSKLQTLTQVTASSSASQAISTGSFHPTAKVEALLKLSATFQFEIRGGLFIITNKPAEADIVSWRLVYDLDLKATFHFEICEPQDQGRVVTKVQGQYIYGMTVSHNATASGVVDLICDNGGLSHVRVENKHVVEVKATASVSVAVQVYTCSNVEQCHKSPCKEDQCRVNVVPKVDAPVAKANSTVPAKGPSKVPAKVPAKGPDAAPAPVPWKFEQCEKKAEAKCYCVQTCPECEVHQPSKGPAPAPIPADKVVPKTPGAPAAPKPDAQPKAPQPTAGQNKPIAPAATNRPPAAGVSSGSARVVVALNVLAGVVGLALFL